MNTNAQALFDNRSATAASATGVVRGNGKEQATSVFDFVAEHLPERAQCRVMCGEGKVAVASHEREIQVFDCNITVLPRKCSRGLVPEVEPLVGDMFLQLGDLPRRFAPATAELPAAGQATLGNTQLGEAVAQPARILDNAAIRQGQQVMHTYINSDGGAIMYGRRNVGNIQHQADIPLVYAALDDHVLDLCTVRNRTVQLDADAADVLHIQTLPCKLAAIAIAVFDALEAVAAFVARRSALALVELTVRLVHTAQHLLNRSSVQQSHFVRQAVTFVTDAVPLIAVGNAAPRPLPGPTPFVQRVIVDGLHLVKERRQEIGLLLGWAEPVLVRADHLAALLFVNVPLNRRGGHTACGSYVIRTRPQVWQAAVQVREFFSQHMRRVALDPMHDLIRSHCWREGTKHVYMIGLNREIQNLAANLCGLFANQLVKASSNRAKQHSAPILWYPNEVVVDVVSGVSGSFAFHERIIPRSFCACKLTGIQEGGAIPHPAEAGRTLAPFL